MLCYDELNCYEAAKCDDHGRSLDVPFLNDYRLKGGSLRARLKVAPRGVAAGGRYSFIGARAARATLVPRARQLETADQIEPAGS